MGGHQVPRLHIQCFGLQYARTPCPYLNLSNADEDHMNLKEWDCNQEPHCPASIHAWLEFPSAVAAVLADSLQAFGLLTLLHGSQIEVIWFAS